MSLAVHALHASWLDLLAAHVAGQPWTFVLGGKGDDPPRVKPGDLVYVAAWGKLRFRAPLTPRRFFAPGPGYQREGQTRVFPEVPAGGLLLDAFHGFSVEIDLARLEPVTIQMPVPWHLGARETLSRPAQEAPGMLADDMERPFPAWAFQGLPQELQDAARRLVPAAVQASAPAAAPPPKPVRKAPVRAAAKPAIAPGAVTTGQSFDLFHRGGS